MTTAKESLAKKDFENKAAMPKLKLDRPKTICSMEIENVKVIMQNDEKYLILFLPFLLNKIHQPYRLGGQICDINLASSH